MTPLNCCPGSLFSNILAVDASSGGDWNLTRLVMHLSGMFGVFNMVLEGVGLLVGLLVDLLEGELLNGVIASTRVSSIFAALH